MSRKTLLLSRFPRRVGISIWINNLKFLFALDISLASIIPIGFWNKLSVIKQLSTGNILKSTKQHRGSKQVIES